MRRAQASQVKVCFVCPHALPLFDPAASGAFGGAEVQIGILARFLVAHGFEVDIVVLREAGAEPKLLDGVRLIPAIDDTARAGMGRKLRSKFSLLKALRRSQADVYVGTCAGPEAAIIALHARLAGKSFVYRAAHEMDCDGSYERANGWRGMVFGFGKRSADLVVAQHDEQRRVLAAKGLPSRVIRNSFEVGEAHPVSERDIDALWVARCEAWKRPELFLELAKRFPSRKFVMICPPKQGHEAYFEKIRGLASECSNLSFIERVPFSEVQSYFESARLFVGTSEYEGFPNTYIQACIAGTPIATLKVDPDKFIATEGAGVAAQGDFERLKSGIDRLLSDSAEWTKCSTNARAYALRSHNVEVEGAKWADLLLAIRGRTPTGSSVGEPVGEGRRG